MGLAMKCVCVCGEGDSHTASMPVLIFNFDSKNCRMSNGNESESLITYCRPVPFLYKYETFLGSLLQQQTLAAFLDGLR